MKLKSKKIYLPFFVSGFALLIFCIWLSVRNVQIVAVHQRNNFSDVLVKNFPLTDKGKISWWLENKSKIEKEYGIPKPADYGNFNITFWDFGEGYQKTDGYDLLCFEDIKCPEKCIEKEALLSVWRFGFDDTLFLTYEGKYRLDKNGRIINANSD